MNIKKFSTIQPKVEKEDEITTDSPDPAPNRALSGLKQLFCGGVAGSTAKTVTAPLSRLTILSQVHSLVTTKGDRPKFSMTVTEGLNKIIQRGGFMSLWRGNGTSVLHRFPFSAINFYVYENVLDITSGRHDSPKVFVGRGGDKGMDGKNIPTTFARLISGGVAGCTACICCYPLDLVRTRLTTEFPGMEQYKGITDALMKITRSEGVMGLYSGIAPTLFVAVPNFAISYSIYGTLKEYVLDDDQFYNLRKINDESGEESLGFKLTLLCGAASGTFSTLVTFPFDTVRRRMQIQNLHVKEADRLTAYQQFRSVIRTGGARAIYRGLTPELMKVTPMVGTMFVTYEYLKVQLNV